MGSQVTPIRAVRISFMSGPLAVMLGALALGREQGGDGADEVDGEDLADLLVP
jgi:hypothetical protein